MSEKVKEKESSLQDNERHSQREDNANSTKETEDAPVKKKKVWPAKYNKGPFICAYCNKKFRGLLDLTRHERIHTNEKPLVCEECGKAFGSDSSLRFHINGHRNIRPYACPTCGATFRHKNSLREHMVVHTDLRPYVCEVCGTGMRQRSSLRKHMRIHTGERPYKCEICDRAFRSLATCRLHQERHADPNSRVNRIPKEPRRIRNRVRGYRKYLPRSVRSEITRELCRQLNKTQTAPISTQLPKNVFSVITPLEISSVDTTCTTTSEAEHVSSISPTGPLCNASAQTSNVLPDAANRHPETPGTKFTNVVSVLNHATKISHGTLVTPVSQTVTPSFSQGSLLSPVTPSAAQLPLSINASGTLPGIISACNVIPVAFDKKERSPAHTLSANSPILVNADQVVTFTFTPLMVIKTPFGEPSTN
ncbi:zinc finger protein 791-like [Acanthaster planci]|uniref:Zinc finger protein 791-like n=1 Tax=Acanthaster planci TaxID=133434 RepID=A0A8B7YPK7_ACAPL|nr:zinc finger protein 791-like [Acanthaster planci]XP_022095213.1 zinc finger protein 791-like [Acanthaster planci]